MALQVVASTTSPTDTLRNVLISEAFVRFFVEACGHYRNHIVTQQDGKTVFEVNESPWVSRKDLTKCCFCFSGNLL
jgi:hypothetical protein